MNIQNNSIHQIAHHTHEFFSTDIKSKNDWLHCPIESDSSLCAGSINQPDQEGNTALINAARNGNLSRVTALVQNDADTSIRNYKGQTAILAAVAHEHEDIIYFLLEKKAHYTIHELLTHISISSQMSLKKLVSSAENIHGVDENGDSSMKLAIKRGLFDVAQRLIIMGVPYEFFPMEKSTLSLRQALQNNNFHDKRLWDLLIDAVDDINEQDSSGNTLLMDAINNNKKHVIVRLIEKGANLELANEKGQTALILAIINSKIKIAQLLIESGAKVHPKNEDKKMRPLFQAVQQNSSKMIQMLLEKREKINTAFHADEISAILELKEKRFLFDNYKKFKKVFSKDVQKTAKGILELVLAQHSHSIQGSLKFRASASNQLMRISCSRGSEPHFMGKALRKDFAKASLALFPSIASSQQEKIEKTLELYEQFSCKPDYQIASHYLSGNTIFIPTGYDTHAVVIALSQNFSAIINRGEAGRKDGIEIFSINKNETNPFQDLPLLMQYIGQHRQHYYQTKEQYLKYINDEFDKPYYTTNTPLTSLLEERLRMHNQIIGNCSWANLIGATRTLFPFMAIEEDSSLLNSTDDETLLAIKQILDTEDQTFIQLHSQIKEMHRKKAIKAINEIFKIESAE